MSWVIGGTLKPSFQKLDEHLAFVILLLLLASDDKCHDENSFAPSFHVYHYLYQYDDTIKHNPPCTGCPPIMLNDLM